MVKAEDLANAGFKYLGRSYKEMDCQKFVEKCLADIGMRVDLPGSNAWYRKMTWTGTPEECKKRFGCVPAGAFLFILAFDGGERARGYTDILGNASHIGIVTNTGKGAIHSSQSRGEVCESAFKGKTIPNGGWNRIGLWNVLSYGTKVDGMLNDGDGGRTEAAPTTGTGGNGTNDTENCSGSGTGNVSGAGNASGSGNGTGAAQEIGKEEAMEQTVTIWAPGGSTVNLRKHQDRGSILVDRIPIGETVILEYQGDEWSRVRYKGKTGYVMSEFLKFEEDTESLSDAETQPEADAGAETVMIQLSREQAEALLPVLSELMNQMKERG